MRETTYHLGVSGKSLFAFELGLGKEMIMRGKRRPIRGNAMSKGRGRETLGRLVTSE